MLHLGQTFYLFGFIITNMKNRYFLKLHHSLYIYNEYDVSREAEPKFQIPQKVHLISITIQIIEHNMYRYV